jgi:hypothetical protein
VDEGEMSMIQRSTTNVASVVSDVGRTGHALTKHNLPSGVAVSFLFDGDADHPFTCQWRVAADVELLLRSTVAELLAELSRAGIHLDPPRYSEGVCYLQDFGPWPEPA